MDLEFEDEALEVTRNEVPSNEVDGAAALPDGDGESLELASRPPPPPPRFEPVSEVEAAPIGQPSTARSPVTVAILVGLGVGLAYVAGSWFERWQHGADVPPTAASPVQTVTPPQPPPPQPIVPPTAAAQASAPKPGVRRTIRSEPRGAEVWMNGQKVGVTPTTITIPPGDDGAEVELRKKGYLSTSLLVASSGHDPGTVALDKADDDITW